MKLRGELVGVRQITPGLRDEMFSLMERYYENVTRDGFECDLEEKQWAIVLRDPQTDGLCGFSTQMMITAEVDGQTVWALFSGDTIIAQEFWGDSALTHVWGNLTLELIEQYPAGRLFWFLISKGYKTYRFLPVFFHEFYPRVGVTTPPQMAKVMTTLGRGKFREAFDAQAGVIRAYPGKDWLRSGVAAITAERLHDPHVRFFLERNPGHARGEELCCLAPLSRENFTAAAYRVIGNRTPVGSAA